MIAIQTTSKGTGESVLSVSEYPIGMPLYREIKRKIAESIHAGEWRPGEALPSEKKLAERFGVSMGTLRKAVDDLVAKGALIRQQGRGTFIATHGKDRYLFSFFHIVPHEGRKTYPHVELLEFAKVKASAEAVKFLGVAAGSRVISIVNSLSLDNQLVIVDEIFLPDSIFPDLSKKILQEREGTLYQLYQEKFGVTVVRTDEHLRAVKADAYKANLLGLRIGDPLLLVIRVARSINKQAVELRHSYINTTHYEYYAELMGSI